MSGGIEHGLGVEPLVVDAHDGLVASRRNARAHLEFVEQIGEAAGIGVPVTTSRILETTDLEAAQVFRDTGITLGASNFGKQEQQ